MGRKKRVDHAVLFNFYAEEKEVARLRRLCAKHRVSMSAAMRLGMKYVSFKLGMKSVIQRLKEVK